MKKYRIIKPIVLCFLTLQDQYDTIITSEDNAILESDGKTIWVIKDNTRHESITQAHTIENWLSDSLIAEIN